MKAELEVAGKIETDPKVLQDIMLNQLNEVYDLQRIVQEFLWVGEIRARTLKLHLKSCYADELLLKTLQKMQRLIQAAEMDVDVQYPDIPLKPVLADEEKLAMVFTNLIENAMKYAGTKKLAIRIRESGAFYCIEFSNGLTSEEQIKSGMKSFEGRGSGLGLWLSREIMNLHTGKLHLKTMPERFFVIQVLLPLNKS